MDISIYLKGAPTVEFAAGETIFTKGDPGDSMFVVKDGAVELRYGNDRSTRVGPGESFGEMSLLDRTTRSANGVAVADTVLYAIDRRLFLVLVGDTPFFALEVMRSMSNRLRESSGIDGVTD